MRIIVLICAALSLAFSPAASADPPAVPAKHSQAALKAADFILSLQNEDGVIPDSPGNDIANEDSNMEYALIGIAAAYRYSKDDKYLKALEKGIRWMAARQEMNDPQWRGSWYYAFETKRPYRPVPTSTGPHIKDVRGVDTTGALFAYLLYLHASLSGEDTFARKYAKNGRAALDFILRRNRSPEGFFFSSWQMRRQKRGKKRQSGWVLYPYIYTADQADVYLGMRAGAWLYNDTRYRQAAAVIRSRLCRTMFDRKKGRYCTGMDKDGRRDWESTGFDAVFAQGYLPWVLGRNPQNIAAFEWLKSCRRPDGALSCFHRDPEYSLSAALYALAAVSLQEPVPTESLEWMTTHTYDPGDGGVRDTAQAGSMKYANVAGFFIMSLLRFPPLMNE